MTSSDNLEGHEVRLFPSAHISGTREAELRAAASLLAMVRAVSEFGRVFVRAAGGPAGRISCYTEVPFKLGEPPARTIRPDGIVHAVRGKKEWSALVEVKVGNNPLDGDQVDAYHRLARDESFDALVTVSNQAALPNGHPPVPLDGRRLRKIPVVHLSWERLLTEAKMLCNQKEVDDPDQHWMLDEWIKYVANEESRIIEPPVLGKYWGPVLPSREGAQTPGRFREAHRCCRALGRIPEEAGAQTSREDGCRGATPHIACRRERPSRTHQEDSCGGA